MLVTVAVAFTAMLVAWRERNEPGAVPLVGMFIGVCVWVVSSLFTLQATTIPEKVLWNEFAWIGVAVIPLAWLLFAMEYTGRDRFVQPTYFVLLAVVPVITVVLALTSESHSLLYSDSEIVSVQGRVFLNRVPGPWFWVAMSYTYLLGALGSIPILELAVSDTTTFKGQSGVLLAGTLVPWLTSVLYVAGVISIPAFDPTPIAFSLSGLAYLAAVTQFQLFAATPSASKHAQRLFIDQLQEGAIVIDDNGFVVDVNRTAARVLGLDERRALGRPATEAIDQYETFETSQSSTGRATISGEDTDTLYDVTHTKITNSRDRTVGSVYTLHDVSDYVRNQQRHRVLNRIFRHNIRTRTNLIISHAELLAADSPRGDLSLVRENAFEIESTAGKAREVLDVFEQSRQPETLVSLSLMLEECLTTVEHDHPAATIHLGDVPVDIAVPSVLQTAYRNAITNAVVHNDSDAPTVWVRVRTDRDTVSVVVADDGPGIDRYERTVIEDGLEDDLSHGSGLGLWLIKWAAEITGGGIEFADNAPSGTVLTITTPIAEGSADATPNQRSRPETL